MYNTRPDPSSFGLGSCIFRNSGLGGAVSPDRRSDWRRSRSGAAQAVQLKFKLAYQLLHLRLDPARFQFKPLLKIEALKSQDDVGS